jgi:hypothetical protein
MDNTNQSKTVLPPLFHGEDDALAKRLSVLGRAPPPVRNERAAKLFNSSDVAAFTSSQWKAHDRDGAAGRLVRFFERAGTRLSCRRTARGTRRRGTFCFGITAAEGTPAD